LAAFDHRSTGDDCGETGNDVRRLTEKNSRKCGSFSTLFNFEQGQRAVVSQERPPKNGADSALLKTTDAIALEIVIDCPKRLKFQYFAVLGKNSWQYFGNFPQSGAVSENSPCFVRNGW